VKARRQLAKKKSRHQNSGMHDKEEHDPISADDLRSSSYVSDSFTIVLVCMLSLNVRSVIAHLVSRKVNIFLKRSDGSKKAYPYQEKQIC
jgi:rRNA maturation endonuclease Nob1